MKTAALVMVVVGLSLLVAQPTQAGSASGTVTNLLIRDSDGLVYVYLSGAGSGRPPCASGTSYWMIVNETSETGKRQYAALLAALASGRPVTIWGKNTCTRWGDGEDIDLVQVQ